MEVVFITLFTPKKENIGGPTAHPYYLAKYRNPSISLTIYTFNLDGTQMSDISQIEKELNAHIIVVPMPKWYTFIKEHNLTKIRIVLPERLFSYIKLPKKYKKEINFLNPDLIWSYPEDLLYTTRSFKQKQIVTTPDCNALVFQRYLATFKTHSLKYFMNRMLLKKAIRLERKLKTSNVAYHIVGREDRNTLLKVNPNLNVYFVHHPHYVHYNKEIAFSQPRIKLLIAGKYDMYMQRGIDDIIPMFKSNSSILKDKYEITFLGRGWDGIISIFKENGYEVNSISWVDDYISEIIKYDIQLAPISSGTGTKGKVLDALCNGLLVIGTEYALENIDVFDGESAYIYYNPEQLFGILKKIPLYIKDSELIAEKGRDLVLKEHDPQKVSSEFFDLINKI
mgnify:FL=1